MIILYIRQRIQSYYYWIYIATSTVHYRRCYIIEQIKLICHTIEMKYTSLFNDKHIYLLIAF